MWQRVRMALPVAALLLLLSMVVSVFVAPGVAGDLSEYVVRPLGAFVAVRWVARWAARRWSAAAGLRGFVPRKTPWAPDRPYPSE